ncbi:unnamed protein product [Phaedon cochleariae]|uniref:FAM69 protein-kinase domain-containing protein n=1 Tax=Phaedon cochleariae TaxID=80249 RepID=A0A9N9SCF9_PHACE|nr:unnamed protein product [Phaedon cochleariae]
MRKQFYYYIILPVLLSMIFLIQQKTVLELCELQTCPFCYGEDMCVDIRENKITLQYSSVSDFIYNLLSVKNVYFAVYDNKKVVLKKLAHDSELHKLDLDSIKSVKHSLMYEHQSFAICDNRTFDAFWQNADFKNARHLSTILQINAEPVLLKIFSAGEDFPVPKLFGFCGRLAIMENCGQPLTTIENHSWIDRCYVAYQILQAAKDFTGNHERFRLYLTDISPDNIVVNDELKVAFVDLEHAVVKMMEADGFGTSRVHHTVHVADTYYYSREELCEHSVSDHNIYGVCMMILSKFSPWPMMEGGLLHDPPEFVTRNHGNLFEYIEMCVETNEQISRFEITDSILNELEVILSREFKIPK